jgi:hypothetical protein
MTVQNDARAGFTAARLGLATLALVIALAGCSPEGTGFEGVRTDVRTPGLGEALCGFASLASQGDVRSAEPLGDHVVVVAVRRCYAGRELVPGDGEWETVRMERATGASAEALVAALRLPSDPPTSGACAAVGVAPTVVDVETDHGEVLRVLPPTDRCGATRREVARAYQQVAWTTVTTRRGKQTRSEAAVLADCQAWKDMLAIEATPERGPGRRGDSPVLPSNRPLRVCLYRANYPAGWEPGDMRVVDGIPENGAGLATVAADVAHLVESAGPAQPCGARHSRACRFLCVSA